MAGAPDIPYRSETYHCHHTIYTTEVYVIILTSDLHTETEKVVECISFCASLLLLSKAAMVVYSRQKWG
jgi:hypothetical protein